MFSAIAISIYSRRRFRNNYREKVGECGRFFLFVSCMSMVLSLEEFYNTHSIFKDSVDRIIDFAPE